MRLFLSVLSVSAALLAFPAFATADAFDYSPAMPNPMKTTSPHPSFLFVRVACPAGQDCYQTMPDLVITRTPNVDSGGLLRQDLGFATNAYTGATDGLMKPAATLTPGRYFYQLQYATTDTGPPYASHRVGLPVRTFTITDLIAAVSRPLLTRVYGILYKADYKFQYFANGTSYVSTTILQRRDRKRIGLTNQYHYVWTRVAGTRVANTEVSATETPNVVYGNLKFRQSTFPCYSPSIRYTVRLVTSIVQANAANGLTPKTVIGPARTVFCK